MIPYLRRMGTTRGIGYRARKRLTKDGMPLLSPFADKAWWTLRLDHPGFGWELSEHAAWHDEDAYRARMLSVTEHDEDARATLRDAEDEVGPLRQEDWVAVIRQVREERRAKLMKRHPYEWARSWTW